jgi:SAM-dependent methyltransferase
MIENPKLHKLFGSIDIYIFDQLLRGNIAQGMRVLEVGCGGGRNLQYMMQAGFDVMGLDENPRAIQAVQRLAREFAPQIKADAFRVESVEESTFADGCAEVVLCNAVLHFARDHSHWNAELAGAWRLLAPGGLFFARLASTIGIEDGVTPCGGGRYLRPDGARLYLVDLDRLLTATDRLAGTLVDPIKTTNVQGLRSMTTWVVRKGL